MTWGLRIASSTQIAPHYPSTAGPGLLHVVVGPLCVFSAYICTGSMASVTLGGFILACGGLAKDSDKTNPRTCGKYDPTSDVWLPMARMNRGVDHAAAGTDGVKMCVACMWLGWIEGLICQ